jgi:hypothetical protein
MEDDPLMFRMIPDFHGIDCARDFDIGPAMMEITPDDFERDFCSYYRTNNNNAVDPFLNMISSGNHVRDSLDEYATEGPFDKPHRGGECEVCYRRWYADEGYEIVAVDGRDDVFMWFDRNRPDLVKLGLISSEHGKSFLFPTRTIINRVLR